MNRGNGDVYNQKFSFCHPHSPISEEILTTENAPTRLDPSQIDYTPAIFYSNPIMPFLSSLRSPRSPPATFTQTILNLTPPRDLELVESPSTTLTNTILTLTKSRNPKQVVNPFATTPGTTQRFEDPDPRAHVLTLNDEHVIAESFAFLFSCFQEQGQVLAVGVEVGGKGVAVRVATNKLCKEQGVVDGWSDVADVLRMEARAGPRSVENRKEGHSELLMKVIEINRAKLLHLIGPRHAPKKF
ncbi:hypothetical protein K402DRAFT_90864 [Aulographum hederae CBS 113979]|uniref:Uncharacterized protein n=1 Tax=Aulographum hederae CBS 113979 TaxID=1176131 RepID=A0A6G1GZE9_9PEZI|nr:hypothetical protein K402DRAFT_90864 [Aulographum hederae CBS 113979]